MFLEHQNNLFYFNYDVPMQLPPKEKDHSYLVHKWKIPCSIFENFMESLFEPLVHALRYSKVSLQ